MELVVTLRHIKPEVYRRVRIPSDATLGQLHELLQLAFGWHNFHLHSFEINKIHFGSVDEESELLMVDEWATPVGAVAQRGSRFVYRYDPGDGWEHDVKVDDRATDSDEEFACVAGERACPPEDCGGPPGYLRLLTILRDPKHAEYTETMQWLGRSFAPEAFNLAAARKSIAGHFKRTRRAKSK